MTRGYFRGFAALLLVILLLAGGAVVVGGLQPDANTLAYKALYDDNGRPFGALRLLDVTRRLEVNLAPHIFTEGAPTWSPDGRYIAFMAGWPRRGLRDIIVLEPLTGDSRVVSRQGDAADGSLTWSPDGQQIAFSRARASGGIVTVDYGGGELSALTPAYENVVYPVWSPDGAYIAFIAYVQRGESSRFEPLALLLDVHTGEVQTLLAGHEHSPPVWSPDGRHIAFLKGLSTARATFGVYVLSVAEGTLRRASSTPLFAWTKPVWQPR